MSVEGCIAKKRRGLDSVTHRHSTRSITLGAPVAVRIVVDNRVERDALARMLERLRDARLVVEPDAGPVRPHAAGVRVLLLDAELHDGMRAVRALGADDANTRVVVMNLDSRSGEIRDFVKEGVSGFILKTASLQEFVETIREVAAGKVVLPASLTDSLFSRLTREARRAPAPGGADMLRMTRREREVIGLVCAGLHNREIAQRLNISSDTVKSHVQNILTKLSLHSRVQIAAYANQGQVK